MLNISRQTKAIMDERVPFIHEGFVTLNPAEMNSVLRHCSFHRQRKIVELHVATLARLMTNDGWLERDKIDFALHDGRLILLNGHHRAAAQIKAGIDIIWTVVIHRRETMAEVDALYYLFDSNIRKRSGQNILQAIGLDKEYKLSKTMVLSLFNAAPIIGTEFYKIPRGSEEHTFQYQLVDERLGVCKEYRNEAVEFESLVQYTGKDYKLRRKLLTAGVCSVALVSLKYCYHKAVEFWGDLAEDDGLRKGDPRKALLVDFSNRATRGTAIRTTVACVRAWNAYFRNEEIKQLKLPKNRTTKFLGTPFTVRS